MLVKISSLVVCLVLIQTNFNVIAGESSDDKNPAESQGTLIIDQFGANLEQIEQGSSISIRCIFIGATAVTYRWIKDRNNYTERANVLNGIVTMKVQDAKIEDSGNYTCMVKSKAGVTYSKTIHVTVIVPGEITPVKINNTIIVNGNITLSCIVRGQSLNSFTWHKRYESEDVKRLDKFTKHERLNNTHVLMSLQLVSVTRDDTGTYECRAVNDDRSIRNRTHLMVLERPKIKDFHAKSIGVGKVLLNCTLFNDNAAVEKYRITARTILSQDNTLAEPRVVSNCNFVLESNKLKKGETYIFVISAFNNVSSSEPFYSDSIRMIEEDLEEMISTEFTAEPTDNSIRIIFQTKNLEPGFSYYYKINVSDASESGHENQTTSSKNATSYTIENLQPETTHSVKVAGCVSEIHKCGQWSTNQKVTTLHGKANSSPSLHSLGGKNLVTLTTIVSMFFSFKNIDVPSFSDS